MVHKICLEYVYCNRYCSSGVKTFLIIYFLITATIYKFCYRRKGIRMFVLYITKYYIHVFPTEQSCPTIIEKFF